MAVPNFTKSNLCPSLTNCAGYLVLDIDTVLAGSVRRGIRGIKDNSLGHGCPLNWIFVKNGLLSC